MSAIQVLSKSHSALRTPHSALIQRILVIRLDRIGDVVLSTPVLQVLRGAYPSAFMAMMVRPVCHELVEGHPSLNEVILYDKDGRHKGIVSTIRFACSLRRFRFDTALILHPSNRSHWIPWLAGIPVRIGYDRKSPWLLTRRIAHRKQEGNKHEAEYTLDMVRVFGIDPPAPRPFVPIHPQTDERVEQLLREQGIGHEDVLVAIHPSASDLSKRWPHERFASVADRLIEGYRSTVILVTGPQEVAHAEAVERAMRHRPVNLAGKLSVGELACVLKRCRVLLSNDSAPVHVAAAVGTPVLAIFGRAQPGLGARRWGPLGLQHVVLQKDGACVIPHPHDCDFERCRLTALSVDEVYRCALSVLQRPTYA